MTKRRGEPTDEPDATSPEQRQRLAALQPVDDLRASPGPEAALQELEADLRLERIERREQQLREREQRLDRRERELAAFVAQAQQRLTG